MVISDYQDSDAGHKNKKFKNPAVHQKEKVLNRDLEGRSQVSRKGEL